MTEKLFLPLHRTKQGIFFLCVWHLQMNVTVELIYWYRFVFSVMTNIRIAEDKDTNCKGKPNGEINAMQSSPDSCSF